MGGQAVLEGRADIHLVARSAGLDEFTKVGVVAFYVGVGGDGSASIRYCFSFKIASRIAPGCQRQRTQTAGDGAISTRVR